MNVQEKYEENILNAINPGEKSGTDGQRKGKEH